MDTSKLPLEDWYDDELKALINDINSNKKAAKGEQVPQTDAALYNAQRELLTQLFLARRKAHLTQAQLADKTGLAQSALARIEAGKHNPSLQTLLKLADKLDMRITLMPKRR